MTLEGEPGSAKSTPVPASATLTGLSGAVSAMAKAALRLPVAAGVNVNPMLQLPPAARTCPVQASAVNWKSAELGPDKLIVLTVNQTRSHLDRDRHRRTLLSLTTAERE